MKKSLFLITLMFATSVFAAETEKVCIKNAQGKETCKIVKVHKKLEREIIKELDMTAIAQGNDCIACEG